ncbi:MAG: IS66 family insertion sequence element accessory protein TnpB [Actinobacteria bacterium]|nr:IS66 family insertion sequence element accessory protein TnpB [Actinomycetota bacterium]
MLPLDASVYVATETVDMRWSFDILAGLVRERLGEDPRSGDLFMFFGRRFDRAKILFFDKSGYALLYKRLDVGTFRLPEVIEPGASSVCIDPEELALLLEGLELPTDAPARSRRRKTH